MPIQVSKENNGAILTINCKSARPTPPEVAAIQRVLKKMEVSDLREPVSAT